MRTCTLRCLLRSQSPVCARSSYGAYNGARAAPSPWEALCAETLESFGSSGARPALAASAIQVGTRSA
eukprot:2153785-Alexandrium_andersonii.AAC.1